MDEKARIHHIVGELLLPRAQWALAGSGVMVMEGMDRTPNDLDIYCTTATWVRLYHSLPQWNVFIPDANDPVSRCDPPYLCHKMLGLEVNIFFQWRQRGIGDIDTNFCIHNAKMIEGIPCVPLTMILAWKSIMGRSKDAQDIVAIREFLEISQ